MHTVNGNDIFLTRGDTLHIKINMFKNGEPYIPVEGDVIRFAMKKSYKDPDEDVIVLKTIPIDSLILTLEPQDTKQLPFGKTYVYDIELTDTNGDVDTFINGTLTIGEEVL